MRIVVAVKYVPDIHAAPVFADGRVVRRAEEGALNELDEHAIEAALAAVEAAGSGEVIAITMAGPDADAVIRKTFQMGVGRGIRISDDALVGSDYFATAKVLAAAVRKLTAEQPVDLVITAMASQDGLGSVVPSLIAAELSWPQLTLAAHLDIDHEGGTATVTRDVDGVDEQWAAPLPAVVSVTDHANTPRFPNFKLIMAARSKTVESWTLADLGIDPSAVGQAGARTRVVHAEPAPARGAAEKVVDKGAGGQALADYLIRNALI